MRKEGLEVHKGTLQVLARLLVDLEDLGWLWGWTVFLLDSLSPGVQVLLDPQLYLTRLSLHSLNVRQLIGILSIQTPQHLHRDPLAHLDLRHWRSAPWKLVRLDTSLFEQVVEVGAGMTQLNEHLELLHNEVVVLLERRMHVAREKFLNDLEDAPQLLDVHGLVLSLLQLLAQAHLSYDAVLGLPLVLQG